ncbi:MAG: 50S ribosomal protein L21e [Candidatus Micrarchaeota archaeon]
MAKNSKGMMVRRTKRFRKERKLTVPDRVKTFRNGERVLIALQPSFSGFPAPRYDGRHGRVVERRGKAYVVEISDLGARKELIVSPVHLRRMEA